MVYMSGGKAARHQDSIVHRTNVCGGPKKAGTAPRNTFFLQSNPQLRRAVQSVPRVCRVSSVIQTQQYGYKATVVGMLG